MADVYRIEFTLSRQTQEGGIVSQTSEEIHTLEEVAIVTAFKCSECDETSLECEREKLYECGECSTKFPQSEGGGRNGNMCPQCLNKFGSKVADRFCAECREGEVEEVEAVECPYCQAVLAVEDFVQHCIDDHGGEILGQ